MNRSHRINETSNQGTVLSCRTEGKYFIHSIVFIFVLLIAKHTQQKQNFCLILYTF